MADTDVDGPVRGLQPHLGGLPGGVGSYKCMRFSQAERLRPSVSTGGPDLGSAVSPGGRSVSPEEDQQLGSHSGHELGAESSQRVPAPIALFASPALKLLTEAPGCPLPAARVWKGGGSWELLVEGRAAPWTLASSREVRSGQVHTGAWAAEREAGGGVLAVHGHTGQWPHCYRTGSHLSAHQPLIPGPATCPGGQGPGRPPAHGKGKCSRGRGLSLPICAVGPWDPQRP